MSGKLPALPLTPERIAALRGILATGNRYEKLDAIEEAGQAGAHAAPLVPNLARLLTSEEYVPCESLDFPYWGHAPLGEEAVGAMQLIGKAPDVPTLLALLDDTRVFELPEASYDQGAYIGDYGTDYIAPAGLAAQLVPLMGADSVELLPVLERNAQIERKEIGAPARRAILDLATIMAIAPDAARQVYVATVDRIAALPDVIAPKTHLGFDLRDLVAACRRRLRSA